jgi:hypothetical protein
MKKLKDLNKLNNSSFQRYDTIKEIVMYMVRSKRTWTDDDIYRLFLIDDKELEEIYELYTSINHYLSNEVHIE